MIFNQEEFNEFVLEKNIIKIREKPIKLSSRRKSSWYVNWRVNDVFLMDQISQFVLDYAEDCELEPDCFYGVPEGATRLGILTQYKYAALSDNYGKGSHPLPMGRGKPKKHGIPKDRYFVGEPKGKVVVLEDVTTTGFSALETLENLRETGSDVIGVISLTNRMERTPIPGKDDAKIVESYEKMFEKVTGEKYEKEMSVEDAMLKAGIPYYSLSDAKNLLPLVIKKACPPKSVIRNLENEIKEYGTEKIKLLI